MINELISAFGTVCLIYVCTVIGVALRTASEAPSMAGIVMMSLQLIPLKNPQYFFWLTFPVLLSNIYISPAVLICSSFIFAFSCPRKLLIIDEYN